MFRHTSKGYKKFKEAGLGKIIIQMVMLMFRYDYSDFIIIVLCLLFFFLSVPAAGDELVCEKIQCDDICYTIKVHHRKSDKLIFEYELTNNSKDAWAVFNRGHTGQSFKETAYCETLAEQEVEFSLKAFQKQKDCVCPLRIIPIFPRASLIPAGETIRGQATVALPPKLHTPFDDCSPLPLFPQKIDRARFCIGVARLSAAEAMEIKRDTVPVTVVEKQKLLCTNLFVLPAVTHILSDQNGN